MHKKLAINKHLGACPYSCKTVATLSLLAALQISSCTVNRRQGLIDSSNLFANAIDLSPEFEQTDAFKVFQQRTADIVSANSDSKNAKTVFFEAVKKGDVKEVQYLLDHLALTPKAVVEGIQFSLKYKDTFSFRYTRKRMVDYLLKQDNLSQDDLSVQDEAGDALFHLIVKRGDIDAAKFLAWKLSVDHLCMQNSENQTPMHLAAACKSKKILEALLYNISKTHPDRVIEELFKKDKNGYSVIERSYLSKAEAFNYLQLPTFSRQGSEMFKFILKILPVRLSSDQLAIIACSIEKAAERKLIDQGYAATLRAILKRYIEKKYGNSADKIVRYVARKKNRPTQVHDEGYASGSELL